MKANQHAVLRRNLLAGMILVPAVPFFLLLVIGSYFFVTSIQSQNIAHVSRIVEDHCRIIESFLNERKGDLQFIADAYSYKDLTANTNLEHILRDLQNKSSAFTDLGVFNAEGVHVAYHGPYELAGKIYKEEEWFRKVLHNGVYISDVFLGYRNSPHFIVAVMKKAAGRTWILRATIDTSIFSDVVEKVRIGRTGEAYILDGRGRYQTRPRSGGNLMEVSTDGSDPLVRHEGVRTFFQADRRGDNYLYAATWLSSPEWLLVVRQEKREAFQALYRAMYVVGLITLLGGLLIVSMALSVTRLIIGRLERVDTEKKELGQQLIIAGRLAEIGEMSAGFAHEINNPLQIIRAEQTLIQAVWNDLVERGDLKESEDTAQILDSIDQIRIQVERCGSITQGLLKFARQKESKIRAVDLTSLLPGAIQMVERRAEVEGVAIIQEIAEDMPPIQADPGHLDQVMINLLNNALDAVTERHGSEGGQITVQSRNWNADQVSIEVTDNGSGISSENLGKVFTPFFSTKPVGKGTGLGLPICYGIVTEMGGKMEISSRPDQGTTIVIRLPRSRTA